MPRGRGPGRGNGRSAWPAPLALLEWPRGLSPAQIARADDGAARHRSPVAGATARQHREFARRSLQAQVQWRRAVLRSRWQTLGKAGGESAFEKRLEAPQVGLVCRAHCKRHDGRADRSEA
jgi:hypothetical protein